MRISDWSSDVCSSDLVAHFAPGDGLSGFDDAGVTLLRHRVEVRAALGQVGFLGNRLEDEVVRSRAGPFRRLGDAGIQLVGQANGGGAHGVLRSWASHRMNVAHLYHMSVGQPAMPSVQSSRRDKDRKSDV